MILKRDRLKEHAPQMNQDCCSRCGKTGLEIFTRIDGWRCAERSFFSQFSEKDFATEEELLKGKP